MDSKQFYLNIKYEDNVLNYHLWIKQADELLAASKKLEPSIKKYWNTAEQFFDPQKGTYSPPHGFKPKQLLQNTYFMLMAYAIENLFKAMLIIQSLGKYEREIRRTNKLPGDLFQHDLIVLVEKINFQINQAETSLLLRLSRNSIWQGRYPVPVKASDLNGITVHKGVSYLTPFLAPTDIPNLKSLIQRIKRQIGN